MKLLYIFCVLWWYLRKFLELLSYFQNTFKEQFFTLTLCDLKRLNTLTHLVSIPPFIKPEALKLVILLGVCYLLEHIFITQTICHERERERESKKPNFFNGRNWSSKHGLQNILIFGFDPSTTLPQNYSVMLSTCPELLRLNNQHLSKMFFQSNIHKIRILIVLTSISFYW